MKNLTEQQYSFSAAAERENVREIKEKPCYSVADYNTELKLTAICSHASVMSLMECGHREVVIIRRNLRIQCSRLLGWDSIRVLPRTSATEHCDWRFERGRPVWYARANSFGV